MSASQQDFLEQYVLTLFDEVGLGGMSEEQKDMYVPQFVAQIETRIGNELVPKLTPDHLEQFVALIDNPDVTPEDWQKFWYTAIPNFEEELKNILEDFTREVASTLK